MIITRYTYQVFPESVESATCFVVLTDVEVTDPLQVQQSTYLSPLPIRTILVGTFPAKSRSEVVVQVGLIKPV